MGWVVVVVGDSGSGWREGTRQALRRRGHGPGGVGSVPAPPTPPRAPPRPGLGLFFSGPPGPALGPSVRTLLDRELSRARPFSACIPRGTALDSSGSSRLINFFIIMYILISRINIFFFTRSTCPRPSARAYASHMQPAERTCLVPAVVLGPARNRALSSYSAEKLPKRTPDQFDQNQEFAHEP